MTMLLMYLYKIIYYERNYSVANLFYLSGFLSLDQLPSWQAK